MNIRTTLLAAGALIAATTLAASPAAATVTVYTVSGTFDDGNTIGGSFSYDDSVGGTTNTSAYTANMTAAGFSNFRLTKFDQNRSTALLLFQDIQSEDKTASVRLIVSATPTNFYKGVLSSNVLTGYLHIKGSPDQNLTNGTVTAAQVAPVPEPATWALMLAGFGLTGAALRRRRQRPRMAAPMPRIPRLASTGTSPAIETANSLPPR